MAQKPIDKQIQKAESNVKNYSYSTAIEMYEEILKKPKTATPEELQKVKLKLAEAYFFVKDYKNAERLYAEVLPNNPILKGDEIKAYQRFAQVLSSLGNRQEASKMWLKYSDLQEQDKRGLEFSKLYKNFESLTRNTDSYRTEYVGLNTSEPDFSPTYYKDGLVFVSGRPKNNAIKRVFKWDNSSFLDLYYLEDLKVLNKGEDNAALGGGGNATADNKKKDSDRLGSDYYTPPTSNDGSTIAHTGSEYISGSKDNIEKPTIEVRSFSRKLNSKYHEGPCTFYDNFEKIVFTRNGNTGGVFGSKKDEISRLKLFTADKTNRDWGNIKELSFNSDKYSCGHPSVSKDNSILFFVSDMPGGYGGTDIYFSRYENGQWATPTNAGGKINTVGNEMFPFVDENYVLYFSTDGHPGLGDLDIFAIKFDPKLGKASSLLRNLGAPLNSPNDDFGFITNADRTEGYFSSNRKKKGTSDDDIWKFTRIGTLYGCRDLIVNVFDKSNKLPLSNSKFSYAMVGNTTEQQSATTNDEGNVKICLPADQEFLLEFEEEGFKTSKQSFSNQNASDFEPATLNVYLERIIEEKVDPNLTKAEKTKKQGRLLQKKSSDNPDSKIFRGVIAGAEDGLPISAVKVKFVNKCNGDTQEMYTKKDGSYEFNRNLECDYELVAFKDDFGTSTEIIEKAIKRTLFGKKVKPQAVYALNLFDTKLFKVGMKIKLENIYYEYDSYKIRENAKKDLDKLANTLKRYPEMIVEISSHTDTRGNAATNQVLSQKRANEVLDYMKGKGIPKTRLKAVGKGETEPLNNCGDGVQCTEAEHQRNRRTEFKILKIEKI
jgi:outer membrane protein OmpA-like peptidoglycan-associated protein/tetratricopeptide (TPR) repeat protein